MPNEIPITFIDQHPTLCGAELKAAFDQYVKDKVREVEDWRVWVVATNEGVEHIAPTFWAEKILSRLREMGYRKVSKNAVVIDGLGHDVEQFYKAEPDPKPEPTADAKCGMCGREFGWGNPADGQQKCPGCINWLTESHAKGNYSAAHPPAEPAKQEEVDGSFAAMADELARELYGVMETAVADDRLLPYEDRRVWVRLRLVAAHCLRRERERAIAELEWVMESGRTYREIIDRINALRSEAK